MTDYTIYKITHKHIILYVGMTSNSLRKRLFQHITDAGVIAQDILKIPELSDFVSGGDYVDTSGNTITERYTLNYNAIFTYGLAATKELDIVVQKQQSEITELKNQNTLLKNALNTLLSEAGKPNI